LILEDDLELRRDFKEYESVLLEELTSKDWDLVHFGYCRDQSPPLVNLPILQPFSGEITGAQFYAVNGKTLEKLIDFFEVLLQRPLGHPDGGPMPADGVLNVFKWQYPEIVRLIAVPSFGDQRSSKSDISPKWFDNISLLASLAGWARKIKKRISSASVR
jgi:glycosyl transferase family 25